MIHVSKRRLPQVEYLLEQSIRGNHVLFETDELRRIFALAQQNLLFLTEEQAYEMEPHIERLLEEPSLESKRAYLRNLSPGEFEQVVLTYFSIVENSLYDAREELH